ncbi:transcription cofactor HES-6-like [Neoarius graeffei]|uniref:transcription cofactor HES-6-like n=1 Tax=Neoarius graeffei TaxID=443677 RepID=UPI00298CB33D|nr:transcription cofactor HES-6-like [Neoarius graeffei]
MAYESRAGKVGLWAVSEAEDWRGDRKMRKPLVEKKRRARINESLQELRGLLTDTELHAKLENAEVLELTVKRVESILRDRTPDPEADRMGGEVSERFTAGYIQCMHEVHTFVSTCPGIDAPVAAELLNHLLERLPLNEDLQGGIFDLGSELLSPTGARAPALSPNSALEETFSGSAPGSGGREEEQEDRSSAPYCTSLWRPW